MARQKGRGGGGFRPPELRGTLGTLLRTTLQQAGIVRDAARDVLERGAREGRSRLDNARSSRKRSDALAELGEIVLGLIRDGEIDVDQIPEAAEIVRHLDDLDDERGHDHGHVHGHGHGHDHDHDHGAPSLPTLPASRTRFDERASSGDASSRGRDDGTVSSSRWTPPRAAASAKVWRPPVADVEESLPVAPSPRKGGIRFDHDHDDDLADYMHPDDVPPKPPRDES